MKHAISRRLVRALSALLLLTILSGSLPTAPRSVQAGATNGGAPQAVQSFPAAPGVPILSMGSRAVFLPIVQTVTPPPATLVVQPGVAVDIRSADRAVRAAFSPRAVNAATRVSLGRLGRPNASQPGLALGGPAFTLSAQRVSDGAAVTQFPPEVQTFPATPSTPAVAVITPSITLMVRYSDADVWGLDLRTLALYTRETDVDAWQRLPTRVDHAQHLLTASVDHFSQFAPFGALAVDAPPAGRKRLALDPDDNVGHAFWPDFGNVRELPYNYKLAQEVQQRLAAEKCDVEILITRDASRDYVPIGDRVGSAANFGADMYTTLAFNALNGGPWGWQGDGGVRGWARNGHPDDDALVNEFFARITEHTGRPHTLGVQHPYPNGYYAPVDSLPASTAYAHIETLFLDHNYDWPVINTGFGHIVDAAYAAISQRLGAAGMLCGNQPPKLPAPPSAEELKRLRDLGTQNYQKYGADPVSFSTGNHVLQVRLGTLPGRGGLDLDLTLTYNAQDGRDDLFGFGWSFPYSARAQHYSDDSVSIVLHDGRTYHYTWDGAAYVAPAGVYDRLEKTGDGWRWITPGETVLTFQEKQAGFGILTEWRDRRGNTLGFGYDLSGQDAWKDGSAVPRPPLTEIRDNSGRVTTLQHDGSGHITGVALADGRSLSFGYSDGDLTSVTDARGGTRRFGYDARHRITHEWDPEGIHFLENRYDDRDRVVGQTDATGAVNTISYDPDGRVTTFVDNGNNLYRYHYDELNRVTAVDDPRAATSQTSYDANYNITVQSDARGNQTRFEYDARGNLTRRTDPIDGYSAAFYSADTTTWTYDAHNQPTSMTNALGATWRYEYDPAGNLVRTTAPDGSETTASYDAQGQLVSRADANSHTAGFTYDGSGNRLSSTDALHHTARSTYDAAGRETSYTDANNHTVAFDYDAAGNVTQIRDPQGRMSTFVYDRNDLLRQATDRRGGVRLYEYDDNLKLTGERDPMGGWTRYEYDALYRRTAAIDPLGRKTRYEYDAAGQLARTIDPTGAATRYEYDPDGHMTGAINPLGHRTTMFYDAVGRLKFQVAPDGGRTEYCYDVEDRLIRTIGPRGEVTDYGYDALGRLTTLKDAQGNQTRYEYDAAGNRTAVIDPLGHRTETSYDALDRPTAVARPALPGGLRPTARIEYDAVGNQTKLTSPRGFISEFSYNANDKLEQTRDPLGGLTRYTYDGEDALTSVTDALGHTGRTAYDLNGRPVRLTDALSQTTALDYDAAGQLRAQTDPQGHASGYTYDGAGRVQTVTDALGNVTRFAHDGAGRMTARTDANGHTTRYAYDPAGRLLAVTDALSGTTSYAYDKAGNLTAITDALSHTTRFDYSFLNQLVQETNPLSGTWRYAYDGAGRMVWRVDALWQATFYDYDSNGRLAQVRYDGLPAQHPISYTYDLDGNQTGMCDALGCAAQRYDALGRLTGVTDWSGQTISRPYDLAGNLRGLTYPDGRAVTYGYDAANRLADMTDPHGAATIYQRDELGRVTRVSRPNGVLTGFSYDAAGRLTGIDNRREGVPQPQSAYAYALDKIGNRTAATERRAAFDGSPVLLTLEHRYEYDALDRLVRASTDAPARSTGYEYDALGNRLGTDGTSYAPDTSTPALPVAPRPAAATNTYNAANQLTRTVDGSGATDLAYNANGDRVRETSVLSNGQILRTDYAYDREDRVTGVTKTLSDTGGVSVTMRAEYRYDGYGRRAVKRVHAGGALTPTQVLTYTYDGLDIIGARLQAGGVVTATNYYLAPSPVTGLRRPAELERLPNAATGFAGDRHWYTSDGLDSVTGLTDADGTLVEARLYDDYGRPLAGGGDLQIFGYTAQDYDAETGLLHFYARSYDPARGVWLTQDTYRGDGHRYLYIQNHSLNSVDTLGYKECGIFDGTCRIMKDISYGASLYMLSQGAFLAFNLFSRFLYNDDPSPVWIDPANLLSDSVLMSNTRDKIWDEVKDIAITGMKSVSGGDFGMFYKRNSMQKPAKDGTMMNKVTWLALGRFDLQGDYEIDFEYLSSRSSSWAKLNIAIDFNMASNEHSSGYKLGNEYDFDMNSFEGVDMSGIPTMVAANAAAWLQNNGYATHFRMYSGWEEYISEFVYIEWIEAEDPRSSLVDLEKMIGAVNSKPKTQKRIK